MTTPAAPAGLPGAGDGRIPHAFVIVGAEVVAFHRIGGRDEIWLLVDGGPVELHLIHPDGRHERRILSLDPAAGEQFTVIESGVLRAARLAPGAGPALLHRNGGSGPAAIEVPRAADILRQHPLHRGIVLDLTAG